MLRGQYRTLIKPIYANLASWPQPDTNVLEEATRDAYAKRKEAIEMYQAGHSYSDIVKATAVSKAEIRRHIQRCTSYDGEGRIYGFRAVVPGVRINDYVRKTPIRHIPGTDSSGCAGALQNLLDQYPEVDELIRDLYYKRGNQGFHEARISIKYIHKRFTHALRQLNFTDQDWPFNTSNHGYKSLTKYCRQLIDENPERAVYARCGKDAARRMDIGRGHLRFLPQLRPYSYVMLDFHKVDAASTIVVTNAYGVELEIPVSRWHIGLLIETHSRSVIGAYISLEMTPSADCVLETVDSALSSDAFDSSAPQWRYVGDGKVLIHQLLPEFQWQGYSAILMDNAFSNCANDVVNNIMDVLGCAVNFGPVRQWWRRDAIEKIFGELTRCGLQRLPSTYGSGPTDTKKDDPSAQAVRFKIRLSELMALIFKAIREFNESSTEALQYASSLQVLTNALERPASGFYRAPLPLAAQKSNNLLQHVEEITVRGDFKKGKRPYFVSDRCTYTNERLARAFNLIGKTLTIYVSRRDCRIVHATVKETGEHLGLMQPESRWALIKCSWRLRKLIHRAGFAKAYFFENLDAVTEWMMGVGNRLVHQYGDAPKSSAQATSGAALPLAKAVLAAQRPESLDIDMPDIPQPIVDASSEAPIDLPATDPFGFSEVSDDAFCGGY